MLIGCVSYPSTLISMVSQGSRKAAIIYASAWVAHQQTTQSPKDLEKHLSLHCIYTYLSTVLYYELCVS